MKAITALTLCSVLSAAPALVVGTANGSFDSPPPVRALSGFVPDVQLPEVAPDRFAVETVVVAVPAPRKAVPADYRGPRTCETRNLELTGGNVRVCDVPRTDNGKTQLWEPVVKPTRLATRDLPSPSGLLR